jgi:hypothetical protein
MKRRSDYHQQAYEVVDTPSILVIFHDLSIYGDSFIQCPNRKRRRVQWTWPFVIGGKSGCGMEEPRNEEDLVWRNLHNSDRDIVERYLVKYSNEIPV